MPGNRNRDGAKPRGGAGGRGGRGGRGGARGGARPAGGNNRRDNDNRVAKPAVLELPLSLTISELSIKLPDVIRDGLTEFKKVQPYFSALEKLLPEMGFLNVKYNDCWLGISGENISGIERENNDSFKAALLLNDGSKRDIFIKRIHLLDPFNAMLGDYILPEDGTMPAPTELWSNTLSKINSPLNEAYVDALFALYASKLVESEISPHWCRCYGTFSGRVEKYIYNISDEYDSLRRKSWWKEHQKLGLFKYIQEEGELESKRALESLFTQPGDILDMDDFVEVEGMDDLVEVASMDGINNDAIVNDGDNGDVNVTEDEPMIGNDKPVKLNKPLVRLNRMSASEGSKGSDDSDGNYSRDNSDYNDEEELVEFSNFPVQISLLELAHGTMDDLLDIEDEEDEQMIATKDARWSAWLFQVIAGLCTAQHYFGFVHNDLHTNNVMWSKTDATHIYYRVVNGKEISYMKVPTYGYVMKIIDFGRASFTVPGAGFFISDAFFPGNDAATQYNCDPFYDSSYGKRVEPNTSFDLCRLAVSLFESLFIERPDTKKPTRILSREGSKQYTETVSPVYNLLWEWLTDDAGKNVLRTPSGEERYPNFDLYRALASDVHNAVPKVQITKPIFDVFRCSKEEIPANTKVYELILAP